MAKIKKTPDIGTLSAMNMFERESSYYTSKKALWLKALRAYNGGREYIVKTLTQHPSETEEEYKDRVAHAYNINLIKYSTNRFGDYIFSKPPRREGANKEIVDDFDRQKKSVNAVMRQIFDYHTLCNLVWVLVDMPVVYGEGIDLKTKQQQKIRPWGKALSPLSVPDWEFDAYGELEWVIIEELFVRKSDPYALPENIKKRTLYTKDYYQTFEATIGHELSGASILTPLTQLTSSNVHTGLRVSEKFPNKLGKVPVKPYTTLLFNEHFNHPAVDDMLTIADAVLAGESELLTNIIKQTYGQLVLPSSTSHLVSRIKSRLAAADPDIDFTSEDVVHAITQAANLQISRTKAIFEEPEEHGIARYIQPDGATTESIMNHDDRLITIMMKLYGFLVGVHTTQKASAESKSVDNVSLAAQLTSIASGLQELELGIWQLFNEFDKSIQIPTVHYNTDYDIHELNAMIMAITELLNINAGDNYQKQVKRAATHILDSLHHIDDKVYEEIMVDIKQGKSSASPSTFEARATHLTDANKSTPDSIKAKTDYQSSTHDKVSNTEII